LSKSIINKISCPGSSDIPLSSEDHRLTSSDGKGSSDILFFLIKYHLFLTNYPGSVMNISN